MSNFIKFKLYKDVDNNLIEFTLLKFNYEHKIINHTRYKRSGFCINFKNKIIIPIRNWSDAKIDGDHFSVYFSSTGTELNCNHGRNRLFYIGIHELNQPYIFTPISAYGDLDFWYDRIINSFKILGNYSNV